MRYYIIAGEASGDLHGNHLMQALQEKDPDAEFRFWGGDGMAAVAGPPVRHIRDLAIMGFIEVLRHLPTLMGNMRFCKQDILAYRPDVVVGIDYPGFNLKIEAWAHRQGFRTVHYISPNLWAWKKGRIHGMRRTLDRLCFILPFEERFFAENGIKTERDCKGVNGFCAVYVGHPLLDAVTTLYTTHYTPPTDKTIALLPGSRRQELKESLPKMVQLARRHPEYRFVVAGMSLIGQDFYTQLLSHSTPLPPNLTVVYDQTYQLLASAYAAIVCSGTATLETALFNVPQVVCYSGNPISYLIARTVVSKRIHYISLVNLIADKPVVTELIQNDFNQECLEREFNLITQDQDNRQRMLDQYAEMHTLLGNGGASLRTANVILQLIR